MARPARPVDPGSEHTLVLAAAEAFARDGYQAASLNEILAAAEWAKSSLYHYFDSKKGLHDHVVSVLRARLGDGVKLPDLTTLTAAGFWPAMAQLLNELRRTASEHPETRYLGIMYHRDDSADPDSALQRMRTDVVNWLSRAVHRGIALGLVRRDISPDLVVELTVAVLDVLDRWAVDNALHAPGGRDAGRLSLALVQSLIAEPV
ncbi:MAG TPA: TetR/AcrR family transcriptional regulator [Terrimesophilobacter sp.]|nr:TetR/AcrR family transcriptional regulator [Terrimesophilobacter sp.]